MSINATWILLSICSALFIQCGFLCIESGLTREKNTRHVALKKLLLFVLSTSLFWLIGFSVLLGEFLHPDTPEGILHLALCTITATLISGAIAERAMLKTYLIIAIAVSVFFYPLFGRWATMDTGWLAQRGFIDPSGSTLVHSLGGWVALAAVIVIGPRLGRFQDDNIYTIKGRHPTLATLGLFFLLVGWIILNLATTHRLSSQIISNTLIMAAVGGITAWLMGKKISQLSQNENLVFGALSGLVASSATSSIVTTYSSVLIATIAAAIFILIQRLMIQKQWDDPLNVVAVHLGAGIWGTLAVAFFGESPLINNRSEQLYAQVLGIISCGLFTFTLSLALFLCLKKFTPLRVSRSEEIMGLNNFDVKTGLNSLLHVIKSQKETSKLIYRAPVEPFSSAGYLANHYNQLMDQLEETFDDLRFIVNDMKDAIISFSSQGSIVRINPSAAHVFGYEHSDLMNANIHQIIKNPQDADKEPLMDHIERLMVAERAFDEFIGIKHSGDAFNIELLLSSRKTKEGQIIFTALIKDITPRKTLESQIKQQGQLTNITLNSIAEGVITCNEHLEIIYINDMACELTSVKSEDCIGAAVSGILQLSKIDYTNVDIQDLFAHSEKEHDIINNDYLLHRKDQTPLIIRCNWNKLQDETSQHIGWVIAIRNVTESRKMQQKLKIQACHDELTGLLNRREFEKQLDLALAETKTQGTNHFLFYLDLDQFKLINDTCGHHAGDTLLKQISIVVQKQLRRQDIIARIGGDEFGIILPLCDIHQSLEVAQKIRDAIKEYRFYWKNKSFALGISIGIVQLRDQMLSREDAISMADAACYTAKDRGRNCVHIYEHEDQEISRRRNQMHWAATIQRALDEESFELFYQSIVPVNRSGKTKHHFEIFIRMKGANGEIIGPDAFIPSAERYGLMPHLDTWVISNTLAWLGEQQRQGNHHYSCAINLSGTSVGNEECLDFIKQHLSKNQILPNTVCFEITETAAMANLTSAKRFIKSLQALDCKLALDDFGSGLSSFGYLRELPVDYLKIDGLFIRELEANPLDKAIVASINTIAHEMHLETVAEFVESPQIIHILESLGVDYAQGHFIDKPQPLANLKKAPVLL